jgi:MFS family permease
MAVKAPDGGFWGWMAVFACFMGNVIGDGVMYSFGVFIPAFKEAFGAGSAEISTIYSIQMGVVFGSGPIASFMTNHLGWRLTTIIGSLLTALGLITSAVAPNVFFLYFSGGICVGLGLGVIYLPRIDAITQYFDKKRPFVTGLAICGSGIGTFIFAPLTEWLMVEVGWENTLYIIGGICVFNCFFGLLFKPLPTVEENIGDVYKVADCNGDSLLEKKEENSPNTGDKNTLKDMVSLLCHAVFMMFAVSNFFTSLGYPIPYTFVPDNAKVLGLKTSEGAFLVALIGITNTVARLVLGILSQVMNRLFLYNTCLVVCGISMAMSNYFQPMMLGMFGGNCSVSQALLHPDLSELEPASWNCTTLIPDNATIMMLDQEVELEGWVCSQWIGQLIYAITYGVTSAAYVLLTTLVLADLLGADKFTNAFGLLLLFQGVATFIGPPVVGAMYDSSCTYSEGFVLMGAMIAFSGLMLYPVPCVQKWMEKDEKKEPRIRQEELQPLA